MAYQTGTYPTPSGLLSILSTFAQANGWTLNDYSIDGDGYRLHIQKGSLYFNFRSYDTGGGHPRILVNGSTGYSAGDSALNQPGSIAGSNTGGGITKVSTSTASYHMFIHGDSITVFAEGTDRWKQMSVGATSLGYPFYASGTTFSDYPTRSGYFLKHSVSGNLDDYAHSVYINGTWTDGASPDGIFNPCTDFTAANYSNSRYMCEPLITMSKSQLRGNTLLIPTHMSMTDTSDNKDVYIGDIPGLYILDATNFVDEDELTYGADTYVISKQAPDATQAEAFLGVACLKA